jgi:presenilin-like A22 family membrane protease
MSDPDAAGDADRGAETPGRDRRLIQTATIYALFFATVLGGVLLARPYARAGLAAFPDASSPVNALVIAVEILIATAVFLLIQRYGVGQQALRVLLLGVFGFLVHYVVAVAVPVPYPMAVGAGLLTWVVLYVYPEWWVMNVAAVVGGAGMTAQFGISLTPFPIVLLLVGMAVYDAYSVYVSEHMIDLVQGLDRMKVPMVFIAPPSLDYSVRESGLTGGEGASPAVLGLGDAFFPGLLAVSAMVYVDAPSLGVLGLNAPALGALVGGFLGMTALHVLLARVQRVHAGLPLLNGGVLTGYAAGALWAGVPLAVAFGP